MTTLENKLYLGIDTSNYTTSVAVVNEDGEVVVDNRKMLDVEQGKRGLRQQEAVFQHVKNLPELIENAFVDLDGEIKSVCASTKPRGQEGSYMPVFMVGEAVGRSIAASLGLPFIETSHQNGHIYAIKEFSKLKDADRFVFFHISGGTSEICLYESCKKPVQIIGGSKDISLGQLIDRVGVRLGMQFPAGAKMDDIASSFEDSEEYQRDWKDKFKKIKTDDLFFNLSGIESAIMRAIDDGIDKKHIVYIIFILLSELMTDLIVKISKIEPETPILIAGGVSESKFIQNRLNRNLDSSIKNMIIKGKYGSDNAIGVALIGREVSQS